MEYWNRVIYTNKNKFNIFPSDRHFGDKKNEKIQSITLTYYAPD